MTTFAAELDRLKAEQAGWERRIALLKSDDLDPDMLDERARVLLDYADPHDLILMLNRPSLSAAAPKP
jgi:cell division protein FtsB